MGETINNAKRRSHGESRQALERSIGRKLDEEPLELEQFADLHYARYAKDTKDVPRGTVLLLEGEEEPLRQIAGFPHVPRTYRLARGVERAFGDRPFHVEEKIDGYNVRLACTEGRVLALTRGGFVCPVTTEWAELWQENAGLGAFFADHPYWVICAEVIGDNPYNAQRDPRLPPGLHLRIFDIRDASGHVQRVTDRYKLIDRYELPSVPRLGVYTSDQMERLYDLLRSLNSEHREGVVLKHANGRQTLKFVTPMTELSDIVDNVPIAFDVGHPYFTNRIFRVLAFVRELGLDEEHYSYLLGRAFMDGYREVEQESEARVEFTVYCRRWESWEAVAGQIGSAVDVERIKIDEAEIDGHRMHRITFGRYYRKSTRRFDRMLSGHGHVD